MSQNSKWWWEQIWFCHAGMLLYRIFFNNWGLASLGRHIIYIMKRLELPSVRDCEHPQIRSHICMRTDWSFWLCWGSEVDKQFMWELSRDAPGLHRFDLRETVQSGWVTWSIALKPHWTSTKPDIPSWCYCSYHVFLIMHRILKHFGKRETLLERYRNSTKGWTMLDPRIPKVSSLFWVFFLHEVMFSLFTFVRPDLCVTDVF